MRPYVLLGKQNQAVQLVAYPYFRDKNKRSIIQCTCVSGELNGLCG